MSIKLRTKSPCPNCHNILDAAQCVTGDYTPKPDDLTVCLYCVTILQFTHTMGLRIADLSGLTFEETLLVNRIKNTILEAKDCGNKLN